MQEVDDIFILKNLLSSSERSAPLSDEQKLVLLDRVQHLCQNWWVISKEFYNLHLLYVGDDNQESQEVCSFIARSQVLLVVAIGLIAVITLQASSEPIRNLVISQRFKLVSKTLEIAYLIQMKLVNVVLTKMPSQIRSTNPYAIQLDQRLNLVLADIGGSPVAIINTDISTISDNFELMAYMDEKVSTMVNLLLSVCQEENKNAP